jgi:MFS family permease
VVYLREQLHRSGGEFGLVLSVAGLGTVLASLVIAARDDHASRTPWAYISILGLGLYCLVWLRLPIVPLLFVALASGASDAGAGIPMSATIAEGLSDAVRGRAYGAIQAINEFGAAAGSVAFAWLGEPGRMGPANALGLAAAVGAVLASLVLWLGGGRAIARAERARLARRRAAQAEPGSA